MQTNLYPQQWMSLPKDVKAHLVKAFGLSKSGVTEIRDQDLVSDGYTLDDLRKISREKMCEYIGSDETFMRSWEITVAKARAELNPPIGEISAGKIVDIKAPEQPKKPFCDLCVAPEQPHLKKCPNYTKQDAIQEIK